MLHRFIMPAAIAGCALLAGCADQGALTTSSVEPSVSASKADPACAPLAQQINALRSEGIADKVAKASVKKYKMTTADLGKADQLNKANADFQAKCGTVSAAQTAAAPTAAATPATGAVSAAVTSAATDAATKKAASLATSAAASGVGR